MRCRDKPRRARTRASWDSDKTKQKCSSRKIITKYQSLENCGLRGRFTQKRFFDTKWVFIVIGLKNIYP